MQCGFIILASPRHFHHYSSFRIILINIFIIILINMVLINLISIYTHFITMDNIQRTNNSRKLLIHGSLFANWFLEQLLPVIRLREVVLKPSPTSTETSITSILSLLVKTVRIFLHSVVLAPKCTALMCPILVRGMWGRGFTIPAIWLTCVSCWHWEILALAYPCTHAYPRSPGRKWQDGAISESGADD